MITPTSFDIKIKNKIINDILPKELIRVKAIDYNPNQGFTRAIRRSLKYANKSYD